MDHVALQSLAHLGEAALVREVVGVAKGHLLGGAVLSVNLVTAGSLNGGLGVRDHSAVLDVEALDGGEGTVVSGDELGDDRELLGRVHSHARAVEVLDSLAVRVEVASVGVAVTGITSIRVGAAAVITTARVLANGGARVRGEGRRDAVRLCRAA